MDLTQLLPFAAFGAITAAVMAAASAMSKTEGRGAERLEELRNPLLRGKKSKQQGVAAMMEKAAPALSKAMAPKSELEANELKVRLANAGFNNPNAVQWYLAIKMACLIGSVALGALAGVVTFGVKESALTVLGAFGGVGFYAPGVVLSLMIRSRKQKLFLSLPDVLDLLVVCVESGLGLDAGMRRVADELQDTHPEICGELQFCLLQMHMGRTKRDVLHDLGVRTGVDDIRALVAILIQAEKFGSSVAQALRVQSDAMRVKRMQIAEEKAQKTAVQMLFPMVIFIFPGIFVVLVGPAAIKFMDQLMVN